MHGRLTEPVALDCFPRCGDQPPLEDAKLGVIAVYPLLLDVVKGIVEHPGGLPPMPVIAVEMTPEGKREQTQQPRRERAGIPVRPSEARHRHWLVNCVPRPLGQSSRYARGTSAADPSRADRTHTEIV